MWGEGLVKLTYLDCGGVARSFCTAVKWLSESKKHRQDCLMSSAQSFYSPCLWLVVHLLTHCFSRNVPLLHISRYVIACDSVYTAFLTLVLQTTNTGVRRPGIWQYTQECNYLRLTHMWWYNECTFTSAGYILERDQGYCRWVGEAVVQCSQCLDIELLCWH